MSYTKSEKLDIIKLVEESSIPVKRTLKEIGLAPSTFYEWYRRYLDDGFDGLRNKHRIPNKVWNQIPQFVKDKIVELALEYPERSPREIAYLMIDRERYFVSESSVFRILKAENLISPRVFIVNTAKDHFEEPTTRVNELWQTDFTYFIVTGWGWYYLSTVMDDYSRYILAWRLCEGMSAEEVKKTLKIAIEKTGLSNVKASMRPGLLTDNGPSYICKSLENYLKEYNIWHTKGRPYHPQTQGKIERYHRSLKNVILLDNYYAPEELEQCLAKWIEYYNNERYHESIENVTPKDKYLGRDRLILKKRKQIKKQTLQERKISYENQVDKMEKRSTLILEV